MLCRASVRPVAAALLERPPSQSQALISPFASSSSSSSSSSFLLSSIKLYRINSPRCRNLVTSTSAPSTFRRWIASDWSLAGLGGVGISGLLLWQMSNRKGSHHTAIEEEEERTAFTVPVLSQTGAQSTKTLTLLTAEESNKRLKEHEASYSVSRRTNPVYRYDTNALASNSPIEDDNCCVILERDPESKVQGDMMFWGVFDGHSGWQTSRRLSTDLVSYVARELDLVFRSSPQYLSILEGTSASSSKNSPKSSFWSLLTASPSTSSSESSPELDLYDHILQKAIKNAFDKMDDEIVNAPVRLLEKAEKDGKWTKPKLEEDGMGTEQTEALNTLLPALSGSCALLAFLDAGRNKLHVACTGDSRAVMGVWEPAKGGGGKWRTEVLSEDQTGRNNNEVKRIKSEHPATEAETVIARGRVLGGLEPSRAFGDARYKWPIGLQERLAATFHPGSVRGRPRNYHTPPYVKATPELVTIDLSQSMPAPKKSLASFMPVSSTFDRVQPQATRFIVLATDGLYDRLSNDEIVSLVGAHLCGVRGTQSRSATVSHVSPSRSKVSPTSASHTPRQEPPKGEGDVFTFEDGNLATHLIRNALGGAKREQVSVLLSIPAPLSRRYRDDITATIILLGDVGPGGERGTGGVLRRDTDAELPIPQLKSKL